MKKLFSTILVAIVATVASYAQTIAVVSSSGSTTMYQDFGKAVNEAKDGSTIYLPGGGFQLNDTIRIKHKVTIMGVSHRADTDNAEGATTIAGNVWFNQGSDGSAVMGCYVSGNINIGEGGHVDNILVRYCNANSTQIKSRECSGIMINQCYMRNTINGAHSNLQVTNSIVHSIREIDGGKINHNVICDRTRWDAWENYYYALYRVNNSIISNNIIIQSPTNSACSENQINNNMTHVEFGDNSTVVSDWKDVFEDESYTKGVNIMANFKFSKDYQKYSDIGIYGGTGFDDNALAPIPRIISKEIPEQTDASGKLNIKVTVKAK